jgi:hypothetical protein
MTFAALLFAAALGAALMALWLWFAWHPERARCALCNASPGLRTAVSSPPKPAAVRARSAPRREEQR